MFLAVTGLCLSLARGSQAAPIVYLVSLSGPNESPPNGSPGLGSAEVDLDLVNNTLHVHVFFSGLQGLTTASHIHTATALPFTGTAGVATTSPTFPGFPLMVTSGTYDITLDLTQSTSYNAPFLAANGNSTAAAEAAFASSFAAGTSYLNIHSTVVPGGEIRGFLTAIPEPASIAMLGTGVLGVIVYAGRRGFQRRRA
jgi:hypothetical protein